MTDLGSLDGRMSHAEGINDLNDNGDTHGFALFTVPEPSAAALLAFAIIVCPLRRWQKSGRH